MWRYPFEVERMGRQFSLYEEASFSQYHPDVLAEVSDNFYQRNPVNFMNYRQYDYFDVSRRYPDYYDRYYDHIREQRNFFPDPYSSPYLKYNDLEDYQLHRKRLKKENDINISNNELNYMTNKKRVYNNIEKVNNEIPNHNFQLNKQAVDPVKLSEQLQKYFGKPSSFGQTDGSSSTSQTDLNHSFSTSHGSGLLVEQMKEVYDSLVAREDVNASDKLWHINERDSNFKAKASGGTCRNCMKIGHSAKTCKNPKKIPLCFICGSENHEGEVCKDVRCSRCLKIGHFPEKCTWSERENAICNLCKIPGHYFEECPDIWRRYHLTTFTTDIVSQPNQLPNPLKFCYNCAEEGHFGHECHRDRIDNYSYPSNPFIISYSIYQEKCNSDKKDLIQGGFNKDQKEETEESIKKRFNIFKELWSKQ